MTKAPVGLPDAPSAPFSPAELTRARATFTKRWAGLERTTRNGRTSGPNPEANRVFEVVRKDALLQMDEMIRQDPRLVFALGDAPDVKTATRALEASAQEQIKSLETLDPGETLNPAVLRLSSFGPAVQGTLVNNPGCCAAFLRLAEERTENDKTRAVGEAALAIGAGASCVAASLVTGGAAMAACALTGGAFFMNSVDGYLRQQNVESITMAGLLGRQGTSLGELNEARERSRQYLTEAALSAGGAAVGVAARSARAAYAGSQAAKAEIEGGTRWVEFVHWKNRRHADLLTDDNRLVRIDKRQIESLTPEQLNAKAISSSKEVNTRVRILVSEQDMAAIDQRIQKFVRPAKNELASAYRHVTEDGISYSATVCYLIGKSGGGGYIVPPVLRNIPTYAEAYLKARSALGADARIVSIVQMGRTEALAYFKTMEFGAHLSAGFVGGILILKYKLSDGTEKDLVVPTKHQP